MNLEGQIEIDVLLSPKGAKQVTITNNRPVHAAQILVGKSIDEVLRTIPLLFHVCGKAQGFAAVQAVLTARYQDTPEELPDNFTALYISWLLLADIELLREHMLRIFMDWPTLLAPHSAPCDNDKRGFEELYPSIVTLGSKFETALFGSMPPFSMTAQPSLKTKCLADAYETLEAFLSQHVFGCPVESWARAAAVQPRDIILHWSTKRETLAAQVCDEIVQQKWAREGEIDVEFLPILSSLDCEALLYPSSMAHSHTPLNGRSQTETSQLPSAPLWKGQTVETTSLSRTFSHGLMQQIASQCGAGLLARHYSRLLEIVSVFLRVKKNIQFLLSQRKDCELPASLDASFFSAVLQNTGAPSSLKNALNSSHPHSSLQRGVGLVEAARGLLMHGVEIEEEVVKDYRILAPTEWNFHPKGALAKSISNIRGTDADYVKMIADFLIPSVDPCTATKLEVRYA